MIKLTSSFGTMEINQGKFNLKVSMLDGVALPGVILNYYDYENYLTPYGLLSVGDSLHIECPVLGLDTKQIITSIQLYHQRGDSTFSGFYRIETVPLELTEYGNSLVIQNQPLSDICGDIPNNFKGKHEGFLLRRSDSPLVYAIADSLSFWYNIVYSRDGFSTYEDRFSTTPITSLGAGESNEEAWSIVNSMRPYSVYDGHINQLITLDSMQEVKQTFSQNAVQAKGQNVPSRIFSLDSVFQNKKVPSINNRYLEVSYKSGLMLYPGDVVNIYPAEVKGRERITDKSFGRKALVYESETYLETMGIGVPSFSYDALLIPEESKVKQNITKPGVFL